MRGGITKRGVRSWRVKFDVPGSGRRKTHYHTVRGTRRDAERELARLIAAADTGSVVDPSRTTLADYLQNWLDNAHNLAGKTRERYGQLVKHQIIPHLGALSLQRLRPIDISHWHSKLLRAGGYDGEPLAARTVRDAHRVLHAALEHALEVELVARNVAHAISPPKVEAKEITALKADQVAPLFAALAGHWLEPLAVLAFATGARRGEILALQWGDIDLDAGSMSIKRSLEQTAAGLKFKPPKTRRGVRTISLPAAAIEALRDQRKRQLERRLLLGQGKPTPETLVFSTLDGDPIAPNGLSRDWCVFVRERKLPKVSFHGLRHSHVSALVASKIDPLTISRRIGHSNVSTTMNVYSHMFKETDTTAAEAIEAALKGRQ